jgi:hypothetical protein
MTMTTQTASAPTSPRVSRIPVNGGDAYLTVTRTARGKYAVDDFSGRVAHDDAFGFVVADCAANVQNLDRFSDSFTCFGISDQVKVGDVVFGIDTIEGPNLEVLRDAAKGLVLVGYDTTDF